jgi:hypothetical protein
MEVATDHDVAGGARTARDVSRGVAITSDSIMHGRL